MRSSDAMTARFPMISSPRGHSIDADTDAILVLEHIDLLAVDRTVRPASIVYRVIAKLPAAFVEYDGRRQTKDRWAFEIWCDLRYPRTNPVVEGIRLESNFTKQFLSFFFQAAGSSA